MSSVKRYIDDIKNRQVSSDKDFILDSLTGAIDRLQKAFPRYGSFLMEFVQNADDAKSNSLRIELQQNSINIYNDGLPFSQDDVKSICKVGRSSKTPKDYIGYLGVGFKSVFLISNCPQIYSGEYQFKFDKNNWEDSGHIPWQIIPIWIEKPKTDLLDYQTLFVLPIETSGQGMKLKEEIKSEYLNNRTLLFLRNITEIEIADVAQNFEKKLVKSELSKTADYKIHLITEYENDKLKRQDIWLVISSICDVPSDVKSDYMTKEWERDNVEKREILVAFKLDEQHNLKKEEKATAHIGVFSFLPLKEIPSGLSFLLQADFLTAPGRGELARECTWNNWLADEIYNMIIKKCIPIFLNHDSWKMNFTDILYSGVGGHELFENHIKNPLNAYLQKNKVLIDIDGMPSKAEELIEVDKKIRGLLSDKELKFLFPNKRILHEECSPHSMLKLEKISNDIIEFIKSQNGEELIKSKIKKKDVEWFKKLHSMFVNIYNIDYFRAHHYRYNVEHDDFWNRMRGFQTPIILTKDYSLAKINECFINPKNIRIPAKLTNNFKIVHPQLVNNKGFKEFINKLNEERYYYQKPENQVIKELTKEDIRNELKMQETLEMDKKRWDALSDKDKITQITEIKNLWIDYSIPLDGYTFLTIKSKNGEWLKPEDVVFSKEYQPEHNLEQLSEKGLLDLPLKFLGLVFIKDNNNDEIREWCRFFKDLGIDRKYENESNSLVQRVSVLTAILYETKNNRLATELGESKKLGYDLESEGRFIEVKGSNKSHCDIFLTPNEFNILQENKEKYFVYVVTDALREPFLRITKGSKLLNLYQKVIIPFNEWSNEAIVEGEFKP